MNAYEPPLLHTTEAVAGMVVFETARGKLPGTYIG
jgi:hypothetical protein